MKGSSIVKDALMSATEEIEVCAAVVKETVAAKSRNRGLWLVECEPRSL